MTEPAKITKSASVDINTQGQPDANATDTPSRWVPKVTLGMGVGPNLIIDGGHFSEAWGKGSDFVDIHGDFALMYSVIDGKKVKLNIGGQLNADRWSGNENTFGSTFNALTLGPRVELDWRRAFNFGDFAIFSRLGIGGALGYGWGTGQMQTTSLHQEDGLATDFFADLNVANVNLGNCLEMGLDALAGSPLIQGGDGNVGARFIGFGITGRPCMDSKVQVRTVKEPDCKHDLQQIAKQQAVLQKLKADNEVLGKQVGTFREYLEAHPKYPFNSENIHKAMVLGYVVEQLQAKGVEVEKIAATVQAGSKAADDKVAEAIAKASGVSDADAQAMLQTAKQKADKLGDLWTLPEDPKFDIKPNFPADPKVCPDVQQYRDDLEEVVGQLKKRQGALEQQLRTAVHLAGLVLGAEDAKKILLATLVNIDTPSFKTARPNVADMSGSDVAAIAKKVFSVPAFEMDKLDKLAKWLNGEGELPGEERTRAILSEEFKKTGQPGLDESPEAKATFKEEIRKLGLAIFGHTDSVGTDENNQKLSERRAQFIMRYLVSQGVDEKRLLARGFGEKYPTMPEIQGADLPIARGKNRRTEFVLLGVTVPGAAPGNPEHTDAAKIPAAQGGAKTPPVAKPATPAAKPPLPKKAPADPGKDTGTP